MTTKQTLVLSATECNALIQAAHMLSADLQLRVYDGTENANVRAPMVNLNSAVQAIYEGEIYVESGSEENGGGSGNNEDAL